MRVILYMATTINGMIAKSDDDTNFVSNLEWKSFLSTIKGTGNMIIGRRTYHIMESKKEFSEMDDINIIVVTKNESLKTKNKNHFVVKSPKEALNLLEIQGFKEALVAGGGKLNASFMKNNLIDEIYIDIEPFVIGNGIKVFSDLNFENKLKLLNLKKLDKGLIQLHYKILK
ncbi:dihydrofolate reductase family protein [Candidatus Woesearchaeota archaeon]|nr:dihydrofolate reductase family protein [Candidatus Woesearchaeota archaeon]